MVKTKKYILAKHFVGEPKEDDFEIVEEELPPLKKGGKIQPDKSYPFLDSLFFKDTFYYSCNEARLYLWNNFLFVTDIIYICT